MLQAYPDVGDCKISPDELHREGQDGHSWFDLQDPTPEESAEVERVTGLRVPTREELTAIEQSSRIRTEKGALYMSAPLVARAGDGDLHSTPTGFILTEKVCLTIRFAPSAVFDQVKADLQGEERAAPPEVFARLLEQVVARAADNLEFCGDELNKASHAIFHEDEGRTGKRHKLTQDTKKLRRIMTQIGLASERMSVARYTLVSVARMAQFVSERGRVWIGPDVDSRMQSVHTDIASLEQYEENLLSRVQMLQDAANAFISIEQNDVVKVLTIASVVGIPPVLIVGIYGMNFKNIPELNWSFGYQYAWIAMIITTLIPLAWFKWKDWI
jgi:magnesium transporter